MDDTLQPQEVLSKRFNRKKFVKHTASAV